MSDKIIIGVIITVLASVLTLYAGIPGAVEQNTQYRIEREKNDTDILKTLVRMEANQQILLTEYHRNVSNKRDR